MQAATLPRPVATGRPSLPSQPAAQGTARAAATAVAYQAAAPATRVLSQAGSPSTVVYPTRTVLSSSGAALPAYAATAAAASGTPVATTVIRSTQASTPLPQTTIRVQPRTSITAATVAAAQPRPPVTLAGPSYTQGAYEAKHQDDPQLQGLKEVRRTCGLKHVPVSDGLQTFKQGAEDGKLSRERFLAAYGELLRSRGAEVPPEAVGNAVFDLFDRDDNNVVDMMELVCGISLLCAGTEEDKIQAVFRVFDENSDGYISMDEMFKFLASVFKVVLTPNVMGVMNSMGVTVESPEDLASVTALECFKAADLNHDGKLSVAEFKNWFYAPRNDPSSLFSPVRRLLQ